MALRFESSKNLKDGPPKTTRYISRLAGYNKSMKDKANGKYWFKRRRYGYGWTPVTWQGWVAVVFALTVTTISSIYIVEGSPDGLTKKTLIYMALPVVAIAILLIASVIKGPKPKWRWGTKPTDSPDEDY